MKYVLILPDGAADEPNPDLGGRTPLEVARIPHMDWIVANGRIGTVRTIPKGFTPGSDVATLSVVGYSPERYYTGRAPLEAAARRIPIGPDDLVFRCNLVTIVDGAMVDFAAGHISQPEAEQLIAELQATLGDDKVSFHSGVSYRHLVKMKESGWMKVKCTPPHDIPGQAVGGHLPSGKGSEAVRELMERSAAVLGNHKINQVRRDLGENPATSIWLWGQGGSPRLPSFRERFGVHGIAIAAVDLIRGIAACVGWKLIEVEGATGYLDTNYHGKGEAAVRALDEADFVAVHVEAPDEAGHNGDAAAKIKALERVDEHIVGPVLEKLRTLDAWRILCVPDHPTPVRLKTHTAAPVPFCMAGGGLVPDEATSFSETEAGESDLHIDPGHELMEYFLKSGRES
ncbi:MAG TPA: cofactor-independent phosphoglycerate mutase [Phycisphaerae bacterium]|nr:cofactor-independent phosphoglycerate mutase [Phycisphaerae bacterium]HRY66946.1 cofactor-independent phosphoglycerate mutase [Phycisphaerae bacterium]HSA27894.1 cofactor-independent phosphoglycerate mutase [Phycisphaerae bacterium]